MKLLNGDGSRYCAVLLLVMGGVLGSEPARSSNDAEGTASWSLNWEVEEVFPLLLRERVEALRSIRGGSPSDLYAALARKWEPGKPILADVDATAYDRRSGSYKLGYLKREGEGIAAVFSIRGAGTNGVNCAWRAQTVGGDVVRFSGVMPCDEPLRFDIPLGSEVRVTATAEVRGRIVVLSTTARPVQRVVVALGDSYASGEGNPDIPAVYVQKLSPQGRQGTRWPLTHDFCGNESHCTQADAAREPAAVWWDRECRRSLVSWPVMSTLWLALDDARSQTRHVVLTYACSGALFDDGGFLAQLMSRTTARSQSFVRDGAETQYEAEARLVFSTRRSQVNSMYDDLCRGQVRRQRLVAVPTKMPFRAWIEDCEDMVAVDELLVSMGGNDLGFGSIAMGMLVASDPGRGVLDGLGLWFARQLMGAASVDEAARKVAEYRPHYGDSIRALMDAARVDARRTTLVAYPNPMVSHAHDNSGCVGRDTVASDDGKLKVSPQRARVRDVNLIMGTLLPRLSWNIIRQGWVVELKEREVSAFRDVFKEIELMQRDAVELKSSPAHGVAIASFGALEQFRGRRMCDPVQEPDVIALPMYFCEAATLNCNVSTKMGGGEWRARSHTEWRHYPDPDRGPKRIIVNWLNDAMLAGRGWLRHPTSDEIYEALGGAVHPTAEAHSAAADQIVRAWGRKRELEPKLRTGSASPPSAP